MTEILVQHRTYIPTLAQRRFLREILSWDGAATPHELGPQTSQESNAARQTCKRRGWVSFDGHYWRITESGMAVLSVPNGEREGGA